MYSDFSLTILHTAFSMFIDPLPHEVALQAIIINVGTFGTQRKCDLESVQGSTVLP